MKKRNNGAFATFCLHILALSLCILPPVVCTLFYFPLWKDSPEKTIAGGALLLLLISFMPLVRLIRERLKSPAGYLIWLCLFLLFSLLASIAREVAAISFYGFVGNALGAVIFKICEVRRKR